MSKDEELAEARASRRAAMIGCGVVVASVVVVGLAIAGVIAVVVAGRNVGPARTGDEIPMKVTNNCQVAARVGWVLSDTAVPFTAGDAARFFPAPISGAEEGAAKLSNPSGLIVPGGSADVGVGRAETGPRPRILVVQSGVPSGASDPPTVTSWNFSTGQLDGGVASPRLVLSGPACTPAGLTPASLPS